MAITSRKTGAAAAQVIRTVGTGGDYSSIATWEGNTDYDLTSGIVYTGSTADVTGFSAGDLFYLYDGATFLGIAFLTHPMTSGQGSHKFSMYGFALDIGTGNYQDADTLKNYPGPREISVTTFHNTGCIEIAKVKAETFTDATFLLSGATTSTSYFRVVQAETQPKGRPWAYPYFVTTSTSRNAVEVIENYSRIHDLRAKWGPASDAVTDRAGFFAYTATANFVGCLAMDSSNTDGTKVAYGFWVYTSNVILINCIAHNNDHSGFASTLAAMTCYNCTSDGNGVYGYYEQSASTTICKNCIGINNATANFQGIDTNINSATANINYKDSANDDFHIIYPSTGANNIGASLASDLSFSFDDDIDFQTRPYGASWDIGADEISPLVVPGGLAFGQQVPTQGEDPESWQTWNDEYGNVPPIIIGDQNWGILGISYDKEGRSLVYFFAGSYLKKFTISIDRYQSGSGTGTIQIRGSATIFYQDDTSPSWTNYTAPTYQTWKYVQVRVLKT